MADNDRQRRNYRSSDQDWNSDNNSNQQNSWQNRGSNYGSEGNRGWGYSGSSRYNQQDESEFGGGHGNTWNQNQGSNRERSGRYNRDFDSGDMNYGNQQFGGNEENWGYGGREYGSNYGGGNYQGNTSYYGSGSQGSGRPSYGGSRNLYDRDYEGYNRGMSNYSGIGASNYGGSNQGGRSYGNDRSSRGYSGSNYGGNYYGSDERREYNQNDPNERSWWDRTRDEVSSWFGDDDAERRRERDRQLNYKGKGPKNYSRSDDRIKEDINDRLSDDPWIDATEIDVSVTNGEVTLTGTVNERTEKRRAEDLAEAVSGVKHVENRVRVGRREEASVGTGTVGSTLSPGSYGAESSTTRSGITGSTSAVPAGKVK